MHFCVRTSVQFWKQPSRKFFAVPEEDLMAPVRTKRRYSSRSRDNDDDDDFETVVRHERKEVNCTCTDKLQEIGEVLGSLQQKVNLVLSLTPETKVPLGLKNLLMDSFSCKICKESPMEPPIIFSKCCRAIVGCETCQLLVFWEDAMTKMCPHCRAERGYAETVRLVGLDDFLQGIKSLLSEGAYSN